ncbi:hypothetical protein FRC03_009332 [Tulasnella sp. 419]|nr:hypothetical protein FRC03_009332 [Tulasnella sp. 419]
MTSYFLSWLNSGGANAVEPKPPVPEIISEEVTTELDDDEPPAFPALNSIQRSSGNSNDVVPSVTLDSLAMPPPPVPVNRRSNGLSSLSSVVQASSISSLTPPPVTTKRMPNTNTKAKARAKVALAPGHSPLDWARLKSSGEDLRGGVTELMRITPSELKEHRTRDDAWAAFGGKVYNITPYLPFHPGGEKELMRVAGRDGTKLFMTTHSWVNLDFMLDGCMVGFLVPEDS